MRASMANANVLLVLSAPDSAAVIERAASFIAPVEIVQAPTWQAAEKFLRERAPDAVIVDEIFAGENALERAQRLLKEYPITPFCLILGQGSTHTSIQVVQRGFFDCWAAPFEAAELQRGLRRALDRRQDWLDYIRPKTIGSNNGLQERLHVLEVLERIGRTVTALNLDDVLTSIVEAAVGLTAAEEGSLLLLDEATGEYFMRASHNFQQEFAQNFRLPVQDAILSEVVKTGKPFIIDQNTPKKIKTAYLVHALIYMPLIVSDKVIGALEVDHRQRGRSFSDEHIQLMSSLAGYAAIAIENAQMYAHSESERSKLEQILTGMEEAIIVVDLDGRVALINPEARAAFGVRNQRVHGVRAQEVFSHSDLLDLISDPTLENPTHVELTVEDGRILNVQVTPIPEVGLVLSMQDITHLKELDRIKSDFVHTVSHDLRSPLTAILGYVELIDRVGPVNEQQREFIHRVQVSVQNITALINDLLDLGRIEAGFDARKEITPIRPIIQVSIDGMINRFADKEQALVVNLPEELPQVLCNPVRMRQMFNNLLVNANKYTPQGGRVQVTARAEGGQIILQVADNGPGIPPSDQPYIFDKFYRATNVSADTPGTGLGLAIVKSIIENHLGRIWVDSIAGRGSTFTIVMPAIENIG